MTISSNSFRPVSRNISKVINAAILIFSCFLGGEGGGGGGGCIEICDVLAKDLVFNTTRNKIISALNNLGHGQNNL